MTLLLFVPLTLFWTSAVLAASDVLVRHLVGEPDYRKVSLRWEAFARNGRALPHFHVRYCELQTWGSQRCRNQDVGEPMTNEVSEDNSQVYETDVNGLRMATTYSFEVRTSDARREDRADDNDNIIIVPTKGFSARATLCLPHASEIEVSTGPYFAGRITVEATDGERCTVDGEPNNPRNTYILHIDHAACGSLVNETTVATYVIVQENLPILTHSTRRFLVLCTYQPETLTVRAGLSLPSARGHSAPVPDSGSARKSRQLRPLQVEAAKLQADTESEGSNYRTTPIIILSLFVILGVCSIAFVATQWRRKKLAASSNDNESLHTSNNINYQLDSEPSHLCIGEVSVNVKVDS